MKRIAALFLALTMLCCLAGCGTEAERMEQLSGTWETVSYFTADSVLDTFRSMDFYEEEIALLDAEAMGLMDIVIFNPDKTYVFTSEAEGSMALADAYYRDVIATFYENRETLSEVYGEDLTVLTEAEFQQYYADLYGVADYEALIDLFVGTIEDYAYLDEPVETGTYQIVGDRIYCNADNGADGLYISYTLEGDELTLDFDDLTLVYTRVQ